jgi:hypothetical protein
MEFNAPWSDTLRMMSAGGSVVVMGAAVLATLKRAAWLRATVLVVVAAFLVGSWGFAPSGYRVDGQTLTVKRPLGDEVIDRGAITGVRMFEEADREGMSRAGGNGGLFGYYGKYKSNRLGEHRWYVTDAARRVVVETKDGAVVVSPEDPAKFIAAVKPGEQVANEKED